MDCKCIYDQNFLKIKEKLNRDKVKLWLPPFLNENQNKNAQALECLADTFSKELSIPSEICFEHLVQLQAKALNNLKERNNFRETGQASLKVRVPNEQGGSTVTVSIALSQTGLALKEEISQAILVPIHRLKVIFKGQFLKDKEILDSQGVKHGLHMMAIVLKDNPEVIISENEKCIGKLNSTREDIELLSKGKYLQVADQSGKHLKLPQEERKSLITAMTLHEKGRVALKREDFSFALVMLLEAEKEFRQCKSSLLKSVDNYGLLNLDIVWCYLNLQSVTQLPDAEERLFQCEQNFIQSYGTGLERLMALKGFTENEAALFMRLHLLQAIVLWHQNKFNQAKILLQKAEEEMKKLKVDDGQLCQLLQLGYGITEARLALRASRGDISVAITVIDNKRLEKKKNEIERHKKKLSKRRKKLGKCLNGEWVEPQLHSSLMSMGFSFEISKWALAQSNNNINAGINLINESRKTLDDEITDKESKKFLGDSLQQVIDFGFEPLVAKRALRKSNGDCQKAVDELLTNGGVLPPLDSNPDGSSSDDSFDGDPSGPSTSELKRKRNEAFTRLAEGFSLNENDHLDLNFVAEAAFLQKYKELINRE